MLRPSQFTDKGAPWRLIMGRWCDDEKRGGSAISSFSYLGQSDIDYWAGRHCRTLKRYRSCGGGLAFLAQSGLGPHEIGVHTLRKGGSPSARPSQVALPIRGPGGSGEQDRGKGHQWEWSGEELVEGIGRGSHSSSKAAARGGLLKPRAKHQY